MGTVELAEVREAGAAGPLMMFQLYVFKERDFVKQLIQREMHARTRSCKLTDHMLATPACARQPGDLFTEVITAAKMAAATIQSIGVPGMLDFWHGSTWLDVVLTVAALRCRCREIRV